MTKRNYSFVGGVQQTLKIARKLKHAHSQTVTSTKKEEKMHGDDIHSGLTTTGYHVVVNEKIPKSVDPGRAFQYIEAYEGFIGSGGAAYQAVKTIACIGHANQCMSATGSGTSHAANPNTASVPYINLNPNAYISGSAFYTAGEGTALEKVFLSKVGFDLRVVNLSTEGVEVDVYIFKNKQNSNQFPDAVWNESCQIHGMNAAAATLPAAGSKTGNVVGYAGSSFVGTNPMYFKEFKKLFQPLKIHHINLGANAQEKIHFQMDMNFMVDAPKIIALNTGYTGQSASWTTGNTTIGHLKGGVNVMLVARGQLGMVSGDGGTPVVFSNCKVGYSVHKHHTFKTVRKTSQSVDPMVIDDQIPNYTNPIKQINIVDVVSNIIQT